MTRSAALINTTLICSIMLLLTPASADGQRRGSVGRGTGVGAANGSGVGTMGTPRRTAVVDFADGNGVIGDGVVGDPRYGVRPGSGRNITRPGVAAAAAARRVPIGTVIEVLPPDCEMTFIYEVEYYYCTGQYYQPMGTETAPLYTAVEPYFPEQY
jgi:hypothetical protein